MKAATSLILYAYPLSLYASRLLCPLLFHQQIGNVAKQKVRKLNALLWYLQSVLSVLMITTVGLAVPAYISAIQKRKEIRSNEAVLISYASVALYFVAGLLPDPVDHFAPGATAVCVWMVGIFFEAVLWTSSVIFDNIFPISNLVMGVARMIVMLTMIIILSVAHWDCIAKSAHSEDTERLLGSSHSAPNDYGTVDESSISSIRSTSKPKAGWLEYFIGFRVLFPYIWPSDSPKHQLVFLASLILVIGQRIINILVPWQLELLVASLGEGALPYKNIALYVTCRALQGQQGILGSARAILWIPVSQSLFRRLTCAAFEHILGLSLEMHLSKRIGEVMSALNKGSALNTFLDGFAFQLFPMVFDLAIAAVYFLIRVDAVYALIIIGVMWSYIYMTIYMAQWRAEARREMARRDREMDAAKMDTMMSYETVHHNGAVPLEAERFSTHVAAYQKSEFLVLFSLNALNITQNMVLTLGILLVVLISAFQISLGFQSVAMFVGILGYVTQLQAPLQFFGSFYNQVQTNLVEAERMLDLFNQRPTIVNAKNAVDLLDYSGLISFRNVTFAYNGRQPTLRNVSFTVRPGTSTAIVGESGSGKSTCLKLLYRFYDTQEGSISLDGKHLRDLKIESFRKHIAIVPQDTILFNSSIFYNLQYANPDATLEAVYAACRAASIHDKILSFPDGYNTKVGERGLRLSGGEKQRVAIARAILKNPQVILLDEATANLDSSTEQQIQEALETLTKGLTTITIAHRLSTITKSDQILVMHQGEIVEKGTHEELLIRGGRYKLMWDTQMSVDANSGQS